MRDADVRSALLEALQKRFAGDPGTVIVEEMPVDASRVDVAVINGRLHGFEIKSDADSLRRLLAQSESYGTVFDEITVVVGSRHLSGVWDLVPDWWGVVEAAHNGQSIALKQRRQAKLNPGGDSEALAWLLWRDEMVEVLRQHGTTAPPSSSKSRLAAKLAASIPLVELRSAVRNQLRSRGGWRPEAPRM